VTVIQGILMGFVAGVTEFLPVSASAHEALLLQLFGMEHADSLLRLMLRLGMLAGLVFFCGTELTVVRHDMRNASRGRNPGVYPAIRGTGIIALILMIPVIVFFYRGIGRMAQIVLLLINGLLVFLCDRLSTGNREMRQTSLLDMLIMGFFSALAVFPGFSRAGFTYCSSLASGFQCKSAYAYTVLLSIPMLVALCIADIVFIFIDGVAGFSFTLLLVYFVAAIFAFGGTFAGTRILKLVGSTLNGFAFYCWGLALLSFILYIQF